ncbi:ankyrin repeat domain-containing protein [Wolbachia endosymbiont (group B) of Aporia crataegi]|uniref:ankyrin repeat domain-containing protein n=1 Tax=Wolbachia endosymbiont (group B) of Aporia crataegi TaxID=2953981 RepID=UPI0022268660|nr:ankyrin repeat domain-containing protein [Wolbachia endosymbiont (group B) of Aporia crataegi]
MQLENLSARYGRLGILEKLLDRGAEVDAKNNRGSAPLHMAAEHGHLEVVEKLLDREAKVDAKNNDGLTPLELANNENKSEVVNFLLGYKDKYGYTLLHYTALDNDPSLIGFLLEKEIDVNAKDNYGCTPLYVASFKDHLNVAEELLDRGAVLMLKTIMAILLCM